MAILDDFKTAYALARQRGPDEVVEAFFRQVAPVLLDGELAVRAAAAAIEAGHGDDLREALTEYAEERARIDQQMAEDDRYAAENGDDDEPRPGPMFSFELHGGDRGPSR
jgi:hypothetical protein